MGVVDAQDAFDLGQKSCEESEVAAGHTNQSCHDFRGKSGVGQGHTGRRPTLLEKILHLSRPQRAELVYKANARVELWKASYAFLDAGHTDQDHAHTAAVENGAHLFKAIYLQSISLIDDNEGSRI